MFPNSRQSRKKNIVRVPHLAHLSNEFNSNQSQSESENKKISGEQSKSLKVLEPPCIM